MDFKTVLAIETSCDDTSVSIVGHDGFVFAVCSANQDLAHEPFGGVVPEIASRNHSLNLLPLVEGTFKKASMNWDDIDGIAVTSRPGLIGALIVGVVTAKSLALSFKKPLIGVNHLEGHLLAPFLKDDRFAPPEDFKYPYVSLAVSGGHTQLYDVTGLGQYRVLGKTIDDAAGEAYDKFAKTMGLGFPGGVHVDRLAKDGNIKAYDFPRSMIREKNYNFSFSGLKASGQRLVEKMSEEERRENVHDLCASYQEAIVDVLVNKMAKATKELGYSRAIVTGGVSANSRLRARSEEWAQKAGIQLVVPPIRYCTDNAAMIGYAGIQHLNAGNFSDQSLAPSPRLYKDDLVDNSQ